MKDDGSTDLYQPESGAEPVKKGSLFREQTGIQVFMLFSVHVSVCVFITAGPITKLFAGGGGGEWTTCAQTIKK